MGQSRGRKRPAPVSIAQPGLQNFETVVVLLSLSRGRVQSEYRGFLLVDDNFALDAVGLIVERVRSRDEKVLSCSTLRRSRYCEG